MQRNIDVVFDYVPTGSISVPTHLFVCGQEERPVRLGEWAPYLRGEQMVTTLDCLHGQILGSPHVDVVLASLTAADTSNQRMMLSTPVSAE
jgi:thioesterase domain-containing protein